MEALKFLLVPLLLFHFFLIPAKIIKTQQNNQVIYALNELANTNIVKQNQEVLWPQTKRIQSSYVLIRHKPDNTYYIQVTIRGQFGYGGIFKYIEKVGPDYKYQRIDETAEDFIYVNYQLSVLSATQEHDESIVIKMINYKTSFGLLLKF